MKGWGWIQFQVRQICSALPCRIPVSAPHSMEPGAAPITTRRLEQREVTCPREVRNPHSTQKTEAKVQPNKSFHILPTLCYCFYICLSRCGSNSFIPQTRPCSADRRMDCCLHSSCLLCLHFCLGILVHLFFKYNKCLYIHASVYEWYSTVLCKCPSHIKFIYA